MSIAQRGARLIHRHDRVAEAGDARAVSERAVERLADADADVLDGVVRAGLQVALGRDRQVEAGRGGRARSSMWSKKPTPVRRAPAPVPSSARSTLMLVSFVVRSIWAAAAHRSMIADPRLHRSRVELEPLGARDRRGGTRERRAVT